MTVTLDDLRTDHDRLDAPEVVRIKDQYGKMADVSQLIATQGSTSAKYAPSGRWTAST
jgi:hypothetical protein